MSYFNDLVEIAKQKQYELRIHVNPHLDNEESLFAYLSNQAITQKKAMKFIEAGHVIRMICYTEFDSEEFYYSFGTDLNDMAQEILKFLEIFLEKN